MLLKPPQKPVQLEAPRPIAHSSLPLKIKNGSFGPRLQPRHPIQVSVTSTDPQEPHDSFHHEANEPAKRGEQVRGTGRASFFILGN